MNTVPIDGGRGVNINQVMWIEEVSPILTRVYFVDGTCIDVNGAPYVNAVHAAFYGS